MIWIFVQLSLLHVSFFFFHAPLSIRENYDSEIVESYFNIDEFYENFVNLDFRLNLILYQQKFHV